MLNYMITTGIRPKNFDTKDFRQYTYYFNRFELKLGIFSVEQYQLSLIIMIDYKRYIVYEWMLMIKENNT